jgi:DEAD/DEAH box helicase domain-containing protein
VDYSWAFTTLYEGAIYMVQSQQYHVDRLDWERRKAWVRRVDSEYYTDAQSYAKVKVLQILRTAREPAPDAAAIEYGEVEVVRKAIGYKKIKFYTQENLGWGDILLPEDVYHTQAAWLTLPEPLLLALGVPDRLLHSDLVDALHGLANLLHGLASLLLMCDGRDLGVVIGDQRHGWFHRPAGPGRAREPVPDRFEPTLFLYDQYSGGIGLAEALHPRFGDLLEGARERLAACPCTAGCPSCVGPEQEVGRVAKRLALGIVDRILDPPPARAAGCVAAAARGAPGPGRGRE